MGFRPHHDYNANYFWNELCGGLNISTNPKNSIHIRKLGLRDGIWI
jgi:hypothetical protein